MRGTAMRKSIFFDLDGTLWDALVPLCESYNESMINNGLPYRFDLEDVRSFMGLTPEETAYLIFPDVDIKKGLEYFYICLNDELEYLKNHPGKLYDGEEEMLIELNKEYDLYVLSNADKGYIEKYLDAYGFKKYFKGHLCAGDTGLDKKDNIIYLMNKNGIREAVYVGDTKKDMEQSLGAGVKFIHAAYGFGEIPGYPYAISSPKELKGVLEKVYKDN